MQQRLRDNRIPFYCCIGISFLLILGANLLTPYLSDDYTYGAAVREARSVFDLFGQEAVQYMTWNGRSVVHMIVRFSLFLPVTIFKIANSACFVLLSLLIYRNVDGHRPCDVRLFTGITLLLWFGSVSFAETILWQTGACNYLWGTTIILGFVTLFREQITACGTDAVEKKKNIDSTGMVQSHKAEKLLIALGFLLFGIIAGWCNENTSGGGLLLTLGSMFTYMAGMNMGEGQVKAKRKLGQWMITGVAGQVTGLIIMVLSPGGRYRASLQEPENYTGIVKYAARFQKITLVLQKTAFWWFAIFLFLLILVFVQKGIKSLRQAVQIHSVRTALGFAAVSLITSYALVLTAPSRERAHFGALVFLFVAIAQLYSCITEEETLVRTLKQAGLLIAAVWFFFFYIAGITDLGRIYRECLERGDVIETQIAAGNNGDIVVPQLRPGFETVLSDAYAVDLTEDPDYWTNVGMAQYYGVDSITAVPRKKWDKTHQ